ncbi:MAG TPA: peptide deformylase [Thermoanaerobaculia bacterium]|nr:peptide deformylase [Thermoanaerobaculia bacterium]
MPVRPIVRLGHPSLRTPARPVAPGQIASAEIQTLIDDMIDTMREARGVGLAAPQVASEAQIFVYEAASPPDRIDAIPLQVVVNPMISPHSRELVYDWEGCLSIPDLRGLVPRHGEVRVQGLDREGKPVDYIVTGFEARIVQHEYDHLNAVIFLDRMRDLRSLAYTAEWESFMAGENEDLDETAVG